MIQSAFELSKRNVNQLLLEAEEHVKYLRGVLKAKEAGLNPPFEEGELVRIKEGKNGCISILKDGSALSLYRQSVANGRYKTISLVFFENSLCEPTWWLLFDDAPKGDPRFRFLAALFRKVPVRSEPVLAE